MKNNYNNILLAAGLILMIAAARIVNADMHQYNFVPIAALGLFSGAVVKDKKYAFLLPILAQLCADVYFELFTSTPGFYGSQIFTYVALVAVTALGFLIKQPKALKVFGFTIGASMVFFLVSNLGFFVQGWNGYTSAGFAKTYVDAIAFYRKAGDTTVFPMILRIFAPDMIGSVLFFGGFYLLQQKVAGKMTKAKA